MPKRKVDVFAGDGSVAGNLRKRRMAMEEGDATGGKNPHEETMPKETNHPAGVLKRGYYLEREDS